MVEIKICGIKTIEDALHAADSGADALGFIFYPPSPRYVTPAMAAAIASRLPGHICKVGVFVNEAAAVVKNTMESCHLDMIQLHGDETPAYCGQFNGAALIRSMPLDKEEDLQRASLYPVRAILVDSRAAGHYGGTGKKASWRLAARLGMTRPLILAGGLNRENIAAALRTVRPQAVDINSGVEAVPGKKDPEKVIEIIRIIREEGNGVNHTPIFAQHLRQTSPGAQQKLEDIEFTKRWQRD